MANTSRKTDTELKTDVLSELKYEPGIKIAEIGVWVKDGTITLNGSVSSYSDKNKAVSAVRRIAGVKAIAGVITVRSYAFIPIFGRVRSTLYQRP